MEESKTEYISENGDYFCHSKHSCTLLNKDATCGFKNGNCIDAVKRDRKYEEIFDRHEKEIMA